MASLYHKDTPIQICHKKNAKYLRLRFAPKENVFYLTVPDLTRQKDIDHFLQKAKDWLDKHTTSNQSQEIGHGATIPVLGKTLTIHYEKSSRKKIVITDDMLKVFHPQGNPKLYLLLWLQEHILQILRRQSLHMAKQLGVTFKGITVKDTTSRWGSCSTTGNLAYCWRIVFAPMEVVEYLCAHEVSHLLHMNHSLAFWTTVASICPDYKKHRQWLKEHGKNLFLIS